MDAINIAVVKEAYGKLAYSHKTQEKAKDINCCFACLVKWLNVILVGATTVSATYTFLVSPARANVVTAGLATFSLMFVIAQLSFDPEAKARAHKSCADKLWLLRENYLNLISDMAVGTITSQTAIEKRDRLTEELFKVYEDAPVAGGFAYFLARKALKVKKELTFSSKELDQLLPEALRVKDK